MVRVMKASDLLDLINGGLGTITPLQKSLLEQHLLKELHILSWQVLGMKANIE